MSGLMEMGRGEGGGGWGWWGWRVNVIGIAKEYQEMKMEAKKGREGKHVGGKQRRGSMTTCKGGMAAEQGW
jgi:hypothetical protein